MQQGRRRDLSVVVPCRGRERGHVNLGWLEAYYTFSFASHYDPTRRGFRSLRALNERWLAPRSGFGEHPHANVEILTLVLEGALEQRDRNGKWTLSAGEVGRLTAGAGVSHDEVNASWHEHAHYLEVWIEPDRADLPPSQERRALPRNGAQRALQVIGAPREGSGLLQLHQGVETLFGRLTAGEGVVRAMARGRHAWIQILAGIVNANGQVLEAGDGAAISSGERLWLLAVTPAEFLLLDLP
ncbi:MAG TPA: pirin family protein [Candidatus Methylomirabilis sp.]|nr:pirin family protein [Candidatus Methylomirabilis sp.]